MDEMVGNLRKERDRFVAFSFAAADLLIEVDQDQVVQFASGASRRLMGLEVSSLIGRPLSEIFSSSDRPLIHVLFSRIEKTGRLPPTTVRLGETARYAVLGACALPGDGRRAYVSLTIINVPGLEKMARLPRDAESGVIAAEVFPVIAGDLATSGRAQGVDPRLTLIRIGDIDKLAERVGQDKARQIVGAAGTYLRARSLGGDGVGRLGDDRYGVIHGSEIDGKALEREIIDLSRDYDPDGEGISARARTLAIDTGTLSDDDLRRAMAFAVERFAEARDEAFHITSLTEALKQAVDSTVTRARDLRHQIETTDFQLVFQPVVAFETRKPVYYETLCRFEGENPLTTFDFAQRVGMQADLDLAIASRAVTALDGMGDARASISVNLSVHSLGTSGFIDKVRAATARLGERRSRLIFEIADYEEIEDLAMADGIIAALRADGHPICLDDFSAAGSSLEYLERIAMDWIKLRADLVQRALMKDNAAQMVRSILALCNRRGIRVAAERLETEDQIERLCALGVQYGQGWLFGKPGPLPGPA